MAQRDSQETMSTSEIRTISDRREWWADPAMRAGRLVNEADGTKEYLVAELYATPRYDDLIHVREVLPGEITITRDDLRKAMGKAGILLKKEGLVIERELFPEGQHGG